MGLPAAGSPRPSDFTHTMPLALHTCTQPSPPFDATTACATAGASAPSNMASIASQVAKRRVKREIGMSMRVYQRVNCGTQARPVPD